MAKRKKIICITGAVLVILSTACAIYLADNYSADMDAIASFGYDGMTVSEEDGLMVFTPEGEIKAGMIFYPGGKVDHKAYSSLMMALAGKGIMCVVPSMPFDLAVLDMNAADGIIETYGQTDRWYVGGHSLGGSMAASYLADNAADFEGLVLLGSYSTADLSAAGLDVLSVYGSEDKVLNMEKYRENSANLPEDTVEYVIEGGNHACFGTYGEQEGDGKALITNKEQIDITVRQIIEFIG